VRRKWKNEWMVVVGGWILGITACENSPDRTTDHSSNLAPLEVSQLQPATYAETTAPGLFGESLAQSIVSTVKQCGEGLKPSLDQCAAVNQAISFRALKSCLEAESKEYEGCYGAYQAKNGGMDCVLQNFKPFWDDCKMPCFFHWNMPYLEGLIGGNRPSLPWGKAYLDCLGICAEEYFVKRCSSSGG